ncbi:tetratricopeptide repeat protein [Candidatus Liberibacter americanus]|uniref:Uncharacterized protein n=1 Tax=Candidatus Liberibacter americanus str. Sao Paulo TaxID=1261131 RepID=U6B485_9HYPH|nr:tetratricopeptide repeat protein [Candidatus Liberibacter americanus]AHA27448.1 hypothetical protein lam_065 [Candidatus Liberibacter americanus str. Sao Paulo]
MMRFAVKFLLILVLFSHLGGCLYLLNDIKNRQDLDISSLSSVIRSHPRDPEGYNVRGVVYGEYGKFYEALQDFQKALHLDRLYYKAYVNRALVYYKMGNFPMALKDYNSALSINPNYSVAYIGRGDVYRTKYYNNPIKALEDFNYAIKLKTPDSAKAFYGRALVYQVLGKHEKAIDDFSKAMSLSSLYADHYNGRGISYLAIKDYNNAIEDFKIAISINPGVAKFWFNQGFAYEMHADYEDALMSYNKSLSIDYNDNKTRDAISRMKDLLKSNSFF